MAGDTKRLKELLERKGITNAAMETALIEKAEREEKAAADKAIGLLTRTDEILTATVERLRALRAQEKELTKQVKAFDAAQTAFIENPCEKTWNEVRKSAGQYQYHLPVWSN